MCNFIHALFRWQSVPLFPLVEDIYFWLRFVFVYQKSLKHTFKTGFCVQQHPLVWFHKGYFVVKIWYEMIWCTKYINTFFIILFHSTESTTPVRIGSKWTYCKNCPTLKFIFTDMEWKLKILKVKLSAKSFCL